MTWIETYSGKRFDLLDPKPEQVDLADIAHALARINRFTGHTSRCYNVAEHSIYVQSLVSREHPKDIPLLAHALLHDAAEAYVGDVSAPMKLAMRAMSSLWGAPHNRSPFDSIEEHVQACILAALGLPLPTPEQKAIIKRADLLMLRTEREAFLPNTGQHHWGGNEWETDKETLAKLKVDPLPVEIVTGLFYTTTVAMVAAAQAHAVRSRDGAEED
jgi:hypothetical protein